MADFVHLEKMGRELKCPICLSLLKSAVSLACNHVFCNLCIVESMRSVSNCPVCKLPFRRREIHPAPHMDNLVSIYKSMEAASGLSIFTTQVGPSKNSEVEPVKCAAENKCSTSNTHLVHKGRSRGKRMSNRKRKNFKKSDTQNSDPSTSTRSFPSNKRVHVTPYPVSETSPTQHNKVSKLGNSTIEADNDSGLDTNQLLGSKRQEEHSLPPLFWLKEADEEDEGSDRLISQETNDLSSSNCVPCFSDLKDSDDNVSPRQVTPVDAELQSKGIALQNLDSEMFEWTQWSCSPELFSTPLKKQTAGKKRQKGFEEVEWGEVRTDIHSMGPQGLRFPDKSAKRKLANHKNKAKNKRNKGNNVVMLEDSNQQNDASKQVGFLGSSRKVNGNVKQPSVTETRKETSKKKNKQIKDIKDSTQMTAGISLIDDNPFSPIGVVEESNQEKNNSRGSARLKSIRRFSLKKCMKMLTEASVDAEKADESLELAAKSERSEISHKEIEGKFKMQKEPSYNSISVMDTPSKSRKRAQKATFKLPRERKRLSLDHVEVETPDHNTSSDFRNDKPQMSESPMKDENIQTDVEEQDEKVRQDCQEVNRSATITSRINQSTYDAKLNDKSITGNPQNSFASLKNKELRFTMNGELRKCNQAHSPIRCAFCHSSSITEVSGEMTHYYDGKSVSVDFNGGFNLIHAHRNCAEWAPDVYFNDDLAINLPTELARGRRITCSCCSIKGATLGCYERTCRKSFHYPCAKLTPECRWDNENFVMLCPSHSSSKLPSETSELQKQNRKRAASKREVQAPSKRKSTDAANNMWTWPSGSACKWVLSTSALSSAEKEIVSKFARLTGVYISKTWSSAVTHVIATADETGACRRTLKFLMGILHGKWILSIEWVKDCMKHMKPVDEEKYEITIDVHGICGGPRLGRMRLINKEPKLFSGLCFYFIGDFVPSYKGYLEDLTTAGGGKVLQRRPISRGQAKLLLDDSSENTLIVYSLEPFENSRLNQNAEFTDHRRAEAQAFAGACGARVVTNSWILDSIAASELQVFPLLKS